MPAPSACPCCTPYSAPPPPSLSTMPQPYPADMQPIRPPWQLLILCNDGYYWKGFHSSRDIQNLVFDTRFSSPASYSQLCKKKKKSIIVKCLLHHYNGLRTQAAAAAPSSEWTTTTTRSSSPSQLYYFCAKKKLAVKKPSNAYISFQLSKWAAVAARIALLEINECTIELMY